MNPPPCTCPPPSVRILDGRPCDVCGGGLTKLDVAIVAYEAARRVRCAREALAAVS